MRRNFFTPAMESVAVDTNISLEEEMLLVEETTQEVAEVSSDLEEAERIIEVSDSLEDLAVIAGGIEDASDTEIALIENTAQMAVAGTEVPPEEVIPAMESFKGKRISIEGIVETAKKIWEKIKAFLVDIWKKIEGFFHKNLTLVGILRKRITAQLKAVKELGDKQPDNKLITSNHYTGVFSVLNKPLKDEKELITAFDNWGEIAKHFLTDNKDLVSAGKLLADGIEKFDANKPEESITPLVKALQSEVFEMHKKPLFKENLDRRFPNYTAKGTGPLLFNKTLVAKTLTFNEGSTLALLDSLRHASYSLENTIPTAYNEPATIEMRTFSKKGMEDLLEECLAILVHVEDYQVGKVYKEVLAQREAIKKASEVAEKNLGKLATEDPGALSVATAHYRAIINLNPTYAKWASQPSMPISKMSLTAINGVSSLVAKSMAEYK